MFFWPKFTQKWIFWSEFWKYNFGFGLSSSKLLCVPISRQNKQFNFFRPKFARKWILGSEFRKSKLTFAIRSSKIPGVSISRQNGQFWFLRPKFHQKWISGLESQTSKSGFGTNTSKILQEPIFRQKGQLWIFGLNLGKLPNYVRYFGSYNVEGVAESWVGVGTRFRNTAAKIAFFSSLLGILLQKYNQFNNFLFFFSILLAHQLALYLCYQLEK